MKFHITTEYNDDFKDIAAITVPVMEEYAARHGYGFLVIHMKNASSEQVIRRRYVLASEFLSGCDLIRGDDWFVHIDADVLLTNLKVKLSEIVDMAAMRTWNPGIIMSQSLYRDTPMLNDGVALFRATPDVLAECRLCARYSYDSIIRCGQDRLHHGDYPIALLPQHQLNAMLYKEEYGIDWPLGQWEQETSFALHLAGISNPRRVELLKEYKERITR